MAPRNFCHWARELNDGAGVAQQFVKSFLFVGRRVEVRFAPECLRAQPGLVPSAGAGTLQAPAHHGKDAVRGERFQRR